MLAVVVGASLGLKARADARSGEIEARATKLLDDRYRDVYGPREVAGWTRPVLRLPELDENAADLRRSAVEKVAKLPSSDDALANAISSSVRNGTPLSPPAQAFVVQQASALLELRHATHGRRAFTHTDPHERTSLSHIPSDTLAATKLLLASATLEPAVECVRIGADAIRVGQDLAPGALLTSALIGDAIIHMAAPLVIRCGDRLSTAERDDAIRELRILAENPPSFGDVLDNEWLFMGYGMLNVARESGADGMRVRWKTWEAVDTVVSEPPNFENMLSRGYPGAFSAIATFDHHLDGSDNPIVQLAKPSLLRYAQEDAKAQAWIRALVIALTIEGENREIGKKTHDALEAPALQDPFTGHALQAKKEADGSIVITAQSPAPEQGPADTDLVRAVIPAAAAPH